MSTTQVELTWKAPHPPSLAPDLWRENEVLLSPKSTCGPNRLKFHSVSSLRTFFSKYALKSFFVCIAKILNHWSRFLLFKWWSGFSRAFNQYGCLFNNLLNIFGLSSSLVCNIALLTSPDFSTDYTYGKDTWFKAWGGEELLYWFNGTDLEMLSESVQLIRQIRFLHVELFNSK